MVNSPEMMDKQVSKHSKNVSISFQEIAGMQQNHVLHKCKGCSLKTLFSPLGINMYRCKHFHSVFFLIILHFKHLEVLDNCLFLVVWCSARNKKI